MRGYQRLSTSYCGVGPCLPRLLFLPRRSYFLTNLRLPGSLLLQIRRGGNSKDLFWLVCVCVSGGGGGGVCWCIYISYCFCWVGNGKRMIPTGCHSFSRSVSFTFCWAGIILLLGHSHFVGWVLFASCGERNGDCDGKRDKV